MGRHLVFESELVAHLLGKKGCWIGELFKIYK